MKRNPESPPSIPYERQPHPPPRTPHASSLDRWFDGAGRAGDTEPVQVTEGQGPQDVQTEQTAADDQRDEQQRANADPDAHDQCRCVEAPVETDNAHAAVATATSLWMPKTNELCGLPK
jgi:hypothetical protein